jgi:hypothetical protein
MRKIRLLPLENRGDREARRLGGQEAGRLGSWEAWKPGGQEAGRPGSDEVEKLRGWDDWKTMDSGQYGCVANIFEYNLNHGAISISFEWPPAFQLYSLIAFQHFCPQLTKELCNAKFKS